MANICIADIKRWKCNDELNGNNFNTIGYCAKHVGPANIIPQNKNDTIIHIYKIAFLISY